MRKVYKINKIKPLICIPDPMTGLVHEFTIKEAEKEVLSRWHRGEEIYMFTKIRRNSNE